MMNKTGHVEIDSLTTEVIAQLKEIRDELLKEYLVVQKQVSNLESCNYSVSEQLLGRMKFLVAKYKEFNAAIVARV